MAFAAAPRRRVAIRRACIRSAQVRVQEAGGLHSGPASWDADGSKMPVQESAAPVYGAGEMELPKALIRRRAAKQTEVSGAEHFEVTN